MSSRQKTPEPPVGILKLGAVFACVVLLLIAINADIEYKQMVIVCIITLAFFFIASFFEKD